MNKIAFIGVGIMGRSMVRNLMKAGFELHIYARTRSKVEDVISEGATFHDTIADCVKDAEAVITIVGFPTDVEEVYFDAGNILDSAKEGAYLIDMTTTSPMLDQKIAEEGTKRGFHVLDAPVTGGDIGAKNGTLSILVGGSREDYEACMPLFEAMGTNINYQGGSGCGQHAKLANQIMIAGTLSGVCEALTYAKAKGLNLQTVLDSVSTGANGTKVIELVKENAKANPNADKDKVDEESQKAEEVVTDEPSGGNAGASKPETGGNSTSSGNGGSTGNGGNSGSNGGGGSTNGDGGSKPQHVHNWVPQTTVVHHEAQVQTVHHDAVYGTGVECNGCFAQFNSYEAWLAHSDSQLDNGNNNCMGYHTIKIVLEQAWDETVEVSPAWDETVTTGYTCSCGAVK